MFELKKFIGFLLMPLPLTLILVALGLILLGFSRRLLSRISFILALLLIVVAGNRAASTVLCASLEGRYKPAPSAAALTAASPLRACTYVAVLGSGHGDAAALSAGQRLSPSARARLIEGMRLALLLPEARLVVSGPRMDSGKGPTHARVQADAAVELGFPRERILEIDTARDTAEETQALARLAGAERVALVTSAWHLPRAMRLAGRAGLKATPCPADYLNRNAAGATADTWLVWDADSLSNSTRAWREYIGLAWTSLTGRDRP
jgi:uncharacterized SAM-binding protein YcdF (DUF218 family)